MKLTMMRAMMRAMKRATTRATMPATQVMQPPPRRTASALGLSLAVGLVAFAAGCPASTDTTPDAPVGGMVEATFTSLYGNYLGNCKQCHAPGAPGRTSDIEQTLDFSTRATALSTLKTGMATGLVGNHTGCNGVPFLAAMPNKSLLVAVLDQPTREVIDLSPQSPNCNVDSITDATVKVGSQPSALFITALKAWITSGAMDN
jgi:mono/diheme cytochrome c family protein